MPRSHSRATTIAVSSAPIRSHDDRDETGDQEVSAADFGVEPHSLVCHDRRRQRPALVERALRQPRLPDAVHIAADDPCRIGIGAADDHLNWCAGGRPDTAREVALKEHDGIHVACDERVFRGPAVAHDRRREIARVDERCREAGRLVGRILDDHRDRHVLGVERHAVPEQQQKDRRQHERDGNAAWIAQDLQGLFPDQAAQPQPGRTGNVRRHGGPVRARPAIGPPAAHAACSWS